MRPSSVHSANDTWATSSGRVQVTRDAPGTRSAKGLVGAGRARRRASSSRSDASVNPVPTFPA